MVGHSDTDAQLAGLHVNHDEWLIKVNLLKKPTDVHGIINSFVD
jgi:hypothetical protein